MQWDMSQIRSNAWNTAFRRGWKAWLSLVTVCFIFSFVGATNASQTSFVDGIDRLTGTTTVLQPNNTAILDSYLGSIPWVSDLVNINPDLTHDVINSISESGSWILKLLALNPRYFESNPNEVVATVIVVALISILLRFCVLNVLAVGQHRYVMETRFGRTVTWRRMLAPFHPSTFLNVLKVMVCYHVSLLLWTPTIVGGIYKTFQYSMVPYLLAENQNISWRDARRLSMQMTDGYEWKMFLTHLSYVYILALRLIPIVGILVSVPLGEELRAEIYFALRKNPSVADTATEIGAFIERTFDGPAFVELTEEEQAEVDDKPPTYLLADPDYSRPAITKGALPYALMDIIYMFFIFCFVGWVWEVGLHFVQAHEFVNRGTLYGPWIPIYGFGGAGIIVLLDRYRDNPPKLFVVTVALCAVLEYATSFILDFMFNASYWDYNDMMFNVNGRICLAGLLAFGFGGLLGIYIVAPAISRWLQKIPVRTRYTGAAVLLAAFCSDFIYCCFNGFNSGAGVGEEL